MDHISYTDNLKNQVDRTDNISHLKNLINHLAESIKIILKNVVNLNHFENYLKYFADHFKDPTVQAHYSNYLKSPTIVIS